MEQRAVQEPPTGWDQPVPGGDGGDDPYAVKRSLGRCWGFSVLSFGLWTYFWFYTYRKLINGELGQEDKAGLHTAGLFVPILNYFIIYWLWRDIDVLRQRVGLKEFAVVPFVVGTVFVAPVTYSFVNQYLLEYWDVRTAGRATDAPVTTGEKAVLAAGICLFVLWLLLIVLSIVVAIVAGSS